MMNEYVYKSVEKVLERMKEDGSKKIQFAEMFMKDYLGVESNKDSKIIIEPIESVVLLSLIVSILVEWEKISNTDLTDIDE